MIGRFSFSLSWKDDIHKDSAYWKRRLQDGKDDISPLNMPSKRAKK